MNTRRAVKQGLRRVGLDDAVRKAEENWPSKQLRREKRDNRHVAAMLAALVGPDDHCVDVGAHKGDVLRQFVRLAPNGRHVAFEPVPSLFEGLEREFGSAPVELHRVALSETDGEAEFTFYPEHPGLSGLGEAAVPADAPRERFTVPVRRLDDVLADHPAPSLIKIDVEGAELGLLRGAEQTLARAKPAILIEHGVHAARAFGATSEDIFDALTAPGLRVFDMDGDGPYERARFAHAVAAGERWNWLVR